GWAEEISVDVDMASAICPTCNILLVEASSNSFANLLAAEDYSTNHANFMSNSWSGTEASGDANFDFHFQHAGKVYVFASGDSGFAGGTQYPASSPAVVAAGGTSLNHVGSSWSETAWSGAGSGCSTTALEARPPWQNLANITGAAPGANCHFRAVSDVSAVGNPSTGVDVYDTFRVSGWLVCGGTSVATPIIASIYAIANNASTTNPSATSGASWLYSHTSGLTDVVGGNNGSCGTDMCNAVAGWDGPTGLGSPLGK